MRMWGVNPKRMCHLHLMAEHREIHLFVNKIKEGAKLDGYYRNGMMDEHKIWNRHCLLETEMKIRNYKIPEKYKTLPDFEHIINSRGAKGFIDIETNLITLMFRCERCMDRMKQYYEEIRS